LARRHAGHAWRRQQREERKFMATTLAGKIIAFPVAAEGVEQVGAFSNE